MPLLAGLFLMMPIRHSAIQRASELSQFGNIVV
jgi:hypothetical protein